jgi:nitric oxide reductase NorD protein
MEEVVGKLWHRFITRAAGGHYPEAVVKLKEIERMTGVFFRALGGDPGLRVAAATADVHGARRSLLSRIAGSDERIARARMDASTLRLPMELDALPERSLNRDLYLWLAALAAAQGTPIGPEDEAALAEAQARLAPLPEGASADPATLELRLNPVSLHI